MISATSRFIGKALFILALVFFMSQAVFQPAHGRAARGGTDGPGYADSALRNTSLSQPPRNSGSKSADTLTYLPMIANCSLLYFDDFSDPASGWPVEEEDVVGYFYIEGEYLLYATSDARFGIGLANYPGDNLSDFLVTVDVRKSAGPGGHYGIQFGPAGQPNRYYFLINELGGYAVSVGNFENGYTILASGTSPALNTGKAANTIAVERSGIVIKVYANGTLIARLEDDTANGPGGIGLSISSMGYASLEVLFDNFKVEPVGCGWSAHP